MSKNPFILTIRSTVFQVLLAAIDNAEERDNHVRSFNAKELFPAVRGRLSPVFEAMREASGGVLLDGEGDPIVLDVSAVNGALSVLLSDDEATIVRDIHSSTEGRGGSVLCTTPEEWERFRNRTTLDMDAAELALNEAVSGAVEKGLDVWQARNVAKALGLESSLSYWAKKSVQLEEA